MGAEHTAGFPPGDVRIFVILGAYGSGKTEIAVNLALRLAGEGRKAALADLDIVNPYFRSREKAEILEKGGVRLIAPRGALRDADLPSIPSELWTLIQDGTLSGVIDLGGDPVGARALAAYAEDLNRQRPAVLYVLNRSRFDNADLGAALRSLQGIQAASGLTATGVISNTHLIADTTAGLVREGAAFAEAFSRRSGLPVACHAVKRALAPELADLSPLFPMDLYMNRPWEV